jgi:hypothetical protein
MEKKTIDLLYRNGFFLIIGVLVSACFGWDSSVPERIDSFRSQIVIGQTSRNTVHERLDEPFISDKRFEVYRVLEGSDGMVTGLVVWEIRDVILYALVVYDDNDVVDDIDWALYQADVTALDYYPHDFYPLDRRSARLQAGGYYFAAFNAISGWIKAPSFLWTREEVLLAPPSVSRRSLVASPPSGMCSVLIFIKQADSDVLYYRLDRRPAYLDDKPVFEIPVLEPYYYYYPDGSWDPFLDIFTKFLVPQGEHEFKITTSLHPSKFRRKFKCNSGEIVYVYPRLKVVASDRYGLLLTKQMMIEGDIEIYNRPVESYEGWRRLLFYSGKWFGND